VNNLEVLVPTADNWDEIASSTGYID